LPLDLTFFCFFLSKQQQNYSFLKSANKAEKKISCCGLADTCTRILPSCLPAGTVRAHWQFRHRDFKYISMPKNQKHMSCPSGISKQYLFFPGVDCYLGKDIEHA